MILLEEIEITLYIKRFSDINSIYEDCTNIIIDDYDIEVLENKNIDFVGNSFEKLDLWVNQKLDDIYRSGDFYFENDDEIITKKYKVPAIEVNSGWYINE